MRDIRLTIADGKATVSIAFNGGDRTEWVKVIEQPIDPLADASEAEVPVAGQKAFIDAHVRARVNGRAH